MTLPDEWTTALSLWAAKTHAVQELWLFGSRAKGTDHAGSDVDLAIVLAPPGSYDWAFGDFVALHSKWRADLQSIVGRHVSLEAIKPGFKGWDDVHATGCMLWHRTQGINP